MPLLPCNGLQANTAPAAMFPVMKALPFTPTVNVPAPCTPPLSVVSVAVFTSELTWAVEPPRVTAPLSVKLPWVSKSAPAWSVSGESTVSPPVSTATMLGQAPLVIAFTTSAPVPRTFWVPLTSISPSIPKVTVPL